MQTLENWRKSAAFAALGETFFSRVPVAPLRDAYLVAASPAAAVAAGLDPQALQREDFVARLNRHTPLSDEYPLAMVYAGHQFGHYNPRLGDGRALLIGQAHTADGRYRELQLKGAGPTPYSRQGDGRAVLRSSIREFLCSEAMHGLGIPTTRALCVIGSGETVWREQAENGAMVLRLSPSHVRFGSFEYFCHTRQHDALRALADFVIREHYPRAFCEENPYAFLLQQVVERTARLIAHWQAVGFAHGVMNTDNMSILGETFDFGPFGFLDDYNPHFICNHSDHSGRYAFDQQPAIGLWNCNALAHAFMPLVPVEQLREILQQYQPVLEAEYLRLMRAKLGVQQAEADDETLLSDLLRLLHANAVDYTIFFRRLCDFDMQPAVAESMADALHVGNAPLRDLFVDRVAFDQWALRYRARLLREQGDVPSVDANTLRRVWMKKNNPKYILRNYLAQLAIEQAQQRDHSLVNELLTVLLDPFAEHPASERLAGFPPDWGKKLSISCSS